MTTQKFMGRNQMLQRLAAQVGSEATAIEILQKRGHLKADGKTFTAKGAARNSMTAEERAIDRATKISGKSASAYEYNPKTNRATLRK
jgi:hypothetical protein